MTDRVSELLHANNVNVEKRRALAAMLRKCRQQFAFYANQHWKKGTPESDEKAKVNEKFFNDIDCCLAVNGPE